MLVLLLVLLLLCAFLLLLLELRHRLRPSSPLRCHPEVWQVQKTAEGLRVSGNLVIRNPHPRMEVMLPRLWVEPTLLSSQGIDGITVRVAAVEPGDPHTPPRPDGYWFASIVKGRHETAARIRIEISGSNHGGSAPDGAALEALNALWLDVCWMAYGPFGHLQQRRGFAVPLRYPDAADDGDGNAASKARWRRGDGCQVLPVATHLLGCLDDPLQVLRRYALPHLQAGDVVAVAETPLAVMQGRYRNPATVHPSPLARQLCRLFQPTSSLATACALQSLIDLVGPARVLCAGVGGVALRLVGVRGGFYRLAGEQARLIDDLTGTIPPYDRTIVLGPAHAQTVAQKLATALGHPVAVVDVNDLGRVKLLAASRGVDSRLVHAALRPNPAGNANEGTPLVVVRPDPPATASAR